MEAGDILGHENTGEVVALGSEVANLKIGDRVVVPFTTAAANAGSAGRVCSPPATAQSKCRDGGEGDGPFARRPVRLQPPARQLLRWSGGVSARADADSGPIKIPDSVTDDQALFLSDILPTGHSDILPTGYIAADNAQIEPGDTLAIWGCGPVGHPRSRNWRLVFVMYHHF